MKRKFKTMDANEAVANIAYRVNEIIAIYPITPSSTMGEWADQWSSEPDFTCHYEGNNNVAVLGGLQCQP